MNRQKKSRSASVCSALTQIRNVTTLADRTHATAATLELRAATRAGCSRALQEMANIHCD
jgi:hydrogenase maturation factor